MPRMLDFIRYENTTYYNLKSVDGKDKILATGRRLYPLVGQILKSGECYMNLHADGSTTFVGCPEELTAEIKRLL